MHAPAQLSLLADDQIEEDPSFLQDQIITYIGNKRSLLPFIGSAIEAVKDDLGRDKLRILDLFSGSGVVARYFKQHALQVIANDLEFVAELSNHHFPASPVILSETVFNGNDRVLINPTLPESHHFFAGQFLAFGAQVVETIFVKLGGCGSSARQTSSPAL